ncbi:hypothetical protein [Pseudomonas chlororaphis]|uniref:hypothetical protein n=1 Tax=Pseudomonas chlororaphis TaxID=587753 RepID=UPI000F574B0E
MAAFSSSLLLARPIDELCTSLNGILGMVLREAELDAQDNKRRDALYKVGEGLLYPHEVLYFSHL